MKKLFLLLLCPFLFINCKGQESDTITKITAKEMQAALKNDVQLVDVRTPLEFSQGHIKNAKNINVKAEGFKDKIQQLDKDKPVYIYCKSGHRSNIAAQEMVELGFTEIYDLKGGIVAWEKEIKD